MTKKGFSERLNLSLDNHGVPMRGRASAIHQYFVSKSSPLSITAIRKWLTGDSFPSRENIIVLSKWLNVSPEWLEYGNSDTEEFANLSRHKFDWQIFQKRIEASSKSKQYLLMEIADSLTNSNLDDSDLVLIRALVKRLSGI